MKMVNSSALLVMFLAIVFCGCESTLYVIEEVEEVVTDEVKKPSDLIVTSSNDTNEIKEDLKSEKIKEDKFEDKDVVSKQYSIQIGAFSNESNAVSHMNKSKNVIQEDIYYKEVQGLYKVRLGKFETKAEALNMLERIIMKGFSDSFLVELTYVKVPE